MTEEQLCEYINELMEPLKQKIREALVQTEKELQTWQPSANS